MTTLILASASPRRRELLTQIGVAFEALAPELDETHQAGEAPQSYVRRLALEKARSGLSGLGSESLLPVLGADTAVVVGDEVLGKPVDKADAMAMLQRLSGRSHRVLSAVAVVGRDDLGQDREEVRVSESIVLFRAVTEKESEVYWGTGEPADKAGGYAIQGLAALFIERIEGSYSGVMGLPLFEAGELLQKFGIKVLD